MALKVTLQCGLAVCLTASFASHGIARDFLVIEDFEGASFGEWVADGDSFGERPARDGLVGVLGRGFAASRRGTGVLLSPSFTIQRAAIHFLMGTQEHVNDGSAGDVAVQLLVNDEVVRTTSPGKPSSKFHAMFWESWDVTNLQGEVARIRILDESSWAHIAVDHIVQSDVPPSGKLLERSITANERLLNFPVKRGAPRHNLELLVAGNLVRTMDVELATDEIDYWVFTDVTPWLGQDLLLRTQQLAIDDPRVLDRIVVSETIVDADDLYQEGLRPQFHFSSQRGWLNDPNGLVYYDGEYHLYYQHNPYGWDHSRNDFNKTWGHAVSTDLVHWQELPGVIFPDHLGSIYSGSAVVDEHNTTGFQAGNEKPIIAVYTSAGSRSFWSAGKRFSQSIAYSNDRGRTFTPYRGNPVQPYIEYINRDPKVIWHAATGQWVIVLHMNDRAMAFFTSRDLKSWELQSEFECSLRDCPELFQLPVDGDPENLKWILYGGSGHYYVGDFDGRSYSAEGPPIKYSYGDCFYASQTFNNMPAEDDRRIQIAWGVIPMEGMAFNMQMLFPVELSLRSTAEGHRLFANPVRELQNIYRRENHLKRQSIASGQTVALDDPGELFDIDAEFEIADADEFGIQIGDFRVAYRAGAKQLSCGGSIAELNPVNEKVRLRILVDRVSIEIFANDGRIYMPIRALPKADTRQLAAYSRGGQTILSSLQVRELSSIWPGDR